MAICIWYLTLWAIAIASILVRNPSISLVLLVSDIVLAAITVYLMLRIDRRSFLK